MRIAAGFDAVSVMGVTQRAILEGARLTTEVELGDEDETGIVEHWPDYLT